MSKNIRTVPAILTDDPETLKKLVSQTETFTGYAQFDIMDGQFVPNLTIGPVVVDGLRSASRLVFDVHLMIDDPLAYVGAFAEAGSDIITFHAEATDAPMRVIDRIRSLGKQVGISIKPKTPVDRLGDALDAVDMVLVMTVEPGFGGQGFIPQTLEKIEQLRDMLGPTQRLEVDGGINAQTTERVVRAGADTLVAGSAVFGAKDPAAAVAQLRRLANGARAEVSAPE